MGVVVAVRIAEDIKAGAYRAQLEALRDRLAAEIDCVSEPRELPPLIKELREVIKTLDSLPVANGATKLGQIEAQRAKRQGRGNAVSVPTPD